MIISGTSLDGFKLIPFCLLATIMIACGNNQSPQNKVTISDVNSFTSLSLPASSVITDVISSDTVVDPVWAVRVSVDKTSYPSLISDIQSMQKDKATSYTSAYAGKVSWWQPKNVIIEKLFISGNNKVTYAIVSEEADFYILYLEYGTW